MQSILYTPPLYPCCPCQLIPSSHGWDKYTILFSRYSHGALQAAIAFTGDMNQDHCYPWLLVQHGGLEPSTNGLKIRYSTN